MKYLLLVCESMADEPLEELGGRTPLEAAKLPNLAKLAQKSTIGNVQLAPHDLGPLRDAAFLAALGVDPLQVFTGPAPLEAAYFKIPHNDTDVVFFCDFVTVLENQLFDDRAGNIADAEAAILLEALNQTLGKEGIRFFKGAGHRNFLVIHEMELAEAMDDLETFPPHAAVGKNYGEFLPKGTGDKQLRFWMEKSRELLDAQEINRVRIDLGENPANRIWLWGQGKRPKMPSFKEITGIHGSVVSSEPFVKGLAGLMGMTIFESLAHAVSKNDFVALYEPVPADKNRWDYRAKVRRLEEFDQKIVGPALALFAKGDCKICVTTDLMASTPKNLSLEGAVPYLIASSGMSSDENRQFHEKAAASGKRIDKGYKLIESFLKG